MAIQEGGQLDNPFAALCLVFFAEIAILLNRGLKIVPIPDDPIVEQLMIGGPGSLAVLEALWLITEAAKWGLEKYGSVANNTDSENK